MYLQIQFKKNVCLYNSSKIFGLLIHLLTCLAVYSYFQVGIVLHYSTLSTMLWIGVTARNIYKQVTKKPQPCPNSDQPSYPKQPLLRYGILSFSILLNVFLKLINFNLSLSFLYSLFFFRL